MSGQSWSARECGCSSLAVIVDTEAHAAWHALVVEQGGPAGLVDAVTLAQARPELSGRAAQLVGTPAERRATWRSLRRTGLVLD